MARLTDQETIAIHKVVCYSRIPRERGMPQHTGPQEEAPGSQEAEGGGENVGKSRYCGFRRKEQAR